MGKSGSFFFFSHDEKFIIKTMTEGDFLAFKKLFDSYFKHVNMFKDSLIARIYGVFSIKIDDQDPVYLILMGFTRKCQDDCYIRGVFDLKGSMVNREVKSKKNLPFKNTATLKDKNFIKYKKDESFLLFEKHHIK